MLSDLAFHLASCGWETCVITSRHRYDDASAGLAAHERVHGVEVHRVWTAQFGRSSLPGRAIDYVTFHAAAFLALLRTLRRGDIVVALTDPPMISVVAAAAAAIRRAHLVNWVHDLFPEVAEALGLRVLALTRPIRNWSLRRAAVNVALSESMAERIRSKGANAVVRHNWADPSLAPMAAGDSSFRKVHGPAVRVVVEYSGNLGRAHDVRTLADALATPIADDIEAWFIGGGAGARELRSTLHEDAAVRFFDYQPRETLADSLAAGDIHLVSLLPAAEGLVVPSKIYGILAAGRPIIYVGAVDGEVARFITDTGIGVAVPSGDANGLREAIARLAADPATRAQMGQNALTAHHREFSAERALAHWETILGLVPA